jgi:hypothetical protein
MLLEIAEKEEEEDSTLRNDTIINKNKNDIRNQSEIYFNQNKKLIFNNNNNIYRKINDESKNNEIINFKNDLKENENNKKEVNIFNNYILNIPNNDIQNNIKVNAINYVNLYNKDNTSKNLKSSFINIANQKNYSPYNIINRYNRLNTKQESLKEMILNEKRNDNIQKIPLPSLNLDINRNKRSLSSNKKCNKYFLEELSSKNINYNSLKNSYSHPHKLHDHKNENNDNINDDIKINLLTSISKSSNILIPIVSKQSKAKKYILTDENNENNIQSKKYKYKIKTLEENNKCNNIDELIKNNGNNSNNRNKIIILDSNNFNNNLFLNIDRTFMSKLHKIKIEKGMNGNKIYERFNRNIFNKEYNYSKTAENNMINNKLPPIKNLKDYNHI